MSSDLYAIIRRVALKSVEQAKSIGFYRAKVQSSGSNGQMSVKPTWSRSPVPHAREVSSPILDVTYAPGSNTAVVSQDGNVSVPAVVGLIWDGANRSDMTVYVRADLAGSPGEFIGGGTKSVLLNVGAPPAFGTVPDGEIHAKTAGGAASGVATNTTMTAALAAMATALTAFDGVPSTSAGGATPAAVHALVATLVDILKSAGAFSTTVKASG